MHENKTKESSMTDLNSLMRRVSSNSCDTGPEDRLRGPYYLAAAGSLTRRRDRAKLISAHMSGKELVRNRACVAQKCCRPEIACEAR